MQSKSKNYNDIDQYAIKHNITIESIDAPKTTKGRELNKHKIRPSHK